MASCCWVALLSLAVLCHSGCLAEHAATCDPASKGRSMLQVATERGSETQQARQVYIDMGANWANTLRLFHDLAPEEQKAGNWEVYAFEAHPLIQPYMEDFVNYLNGEAERPELTVIPSGSSGHLGKYAEEYGCKGVLWKSCMLGKFHTRLRALQPNAALNSTTLVQERLAVAKTRLPANSSHDRFTFIPAAVATEDGWLHLIDLDPVKTIYGGAVAEESPQPNHMEADVRSVNAVSWMLESFTEEDYVMLKMDVEGAEFGILDGLYKANKLHLIDFLAYECHSWMKDYPAPFTNCNDMTMVLSQNHIHTITEGAGYAGYDSFSTPDKYKPTAPP